MSEQCTDVSNTLPHFQSEHPRRPQVFDCCSKAPVNEEDTFMPYSFTLFSNAF